MSLRDNTEVLRKEIRMLENNICRLIRDFEDATALEVTDVTVHRLYSTGFSRPSHVSITTQFPLMEVGEWKP